MTVLCVCVRAHRAKMEKHASNVEVAVKQSPGAEPPRALQPVGEKDIKPYLIKCHEPPGMASTTKKLENY